MTCRSRSASLGLTRSYELEADRSTGPRRLGGGAVSSTQPANMMNMSSQTARRRFLQFLTIRINMEDPETWVSQLSITVIDATRPR
jgi:hypothetical protein